MHGRASIASLSVMWALAQSCSLDPDYEAEQTDVLILGVGIAGIAAARTLEVNGIDNFLVIEATDRIGVLVTNLPFSSSMSILIPV